ncbi:hypothetical protein A1O1_05021 [Capronia coronata CBS 617.96]|uniref:Uncharacterized protein n=1 Tax=Capronia coronata CBS 617.96 TaxID=1182541 RepID=W9Y6D1_9EURO|nr:uncharacterized protein A1O1_05021 [Capronia coronata CBS 617.96]EXJ88093.1 hypothetical protein A1O1_05021 [Capronia coronata CBS 617.96]
MYISPVELVIAFANCMVWLVALYFLRRAFQEQRHLRAEARAQIYKQRPPRGRRDARRRRARSPAGNETAIVATSLEWEDLMTRFGRGQA